MNRGFLILVVAVAFATTLTSCGREPAPCVGPECESPCTGASCADTGTAPGADAANMTSADAGSGQDMQATDAGASDFGASPDLGISEDMTAGDSGLDMSSIDAGFPAPGNSTVFDPDIPFLVRDAAPLANGTIVAGITPPDFAPNESRDAVALHYTTDGTVVWATRFGDPSNDQFLSVASDANGAVLAGVTRGYSVTDTNNNDVLLAVADANGLGTAYNWGTADDELIFKIVPGGNVAAWIAVGEFSSGGPRDGLVAAFDASLQPLWARRYNAGADDYFSGAHVRGDEIIVVGTTGTAGDFASRRALVVSIDTNGVNWARRATAAPSTAFSVASTADAPDRVTVPSSLQIGGNSVAALVRFDPASGQSTAERIGFGSAATYSFYESGRHVVFGFGGANIAPFVSSHDANGTNGKAVQFGSGISTAGFLPVAASMRPNDYRLVLQGANQTIVDVPFSLTPEADCTSNSSDYTTSNIPSDPFEVVNLVPANLTLTGGAIASPRTSALTITTTAMACSP